jgi:hypothetical protein
VAILCAAVLLTSLRNEGLIPSARGEIANAAPADHPLGDAAVELLQSREFAGLLSGRVGYMPLFAQSVEFQIDASVFWPVLRAARGRSAAMSGQRLRALYCVWIV